MTEALLKSSIMPTLLIFFTTAAWGYSYTDNRGLLPIGEVESFMANTGAALSGSTGAVYYNPAGLAAIDRNHISLSANSYLSTHSQVNPIQTIDGVDMNFSTRGLQAIPSAFVSTGQHEKWHYAFSVLIPHQLRVQDSVGYATPTYTSLQISRTNFFQLLMAGFTIATKTENFDVGAGCFYTMYSTTQSSTLNGAKASGLNSLVLNSYFDAQVSGVACNAGLQQQASENLRWGFTARLPLIATSSSGTASQFVQNPNTGISTATGPKSIEPEYELPSDFTLGFEYRLSDLSRTYFDLSYQLSSSYNSGDIGASATENKSTPRASAGFRYLVAPTLEGFCGLGYNVSSVITNDSDYGEDYFVGTFGGRWASGNSTIGIGALYAHSSGSKNSPIYNAALTQTGSGTASIVTEAFGVMISSGYVF
ncbi:hypothetical protein BH10BDE1_BH10BDE1_32800 [soil metagenome]